MDNKQMQNEVQTPGAVFFILEQQEIWPAGSCFRPSTVYTVKASLLMTLRLLA